MDVSTESRSLQRAMKTNCYGFHSRVGICLVEEVAVGVKFYFCSKPLISPGGHCSDLCVAQILYSPDFHWL